VVVVDSGMQTKSGGDGGKPALGQAGQTEFGVGGNRNGSACNGGNGGPGGTGAAGGGGAGGSSIAVVYKGPMPDVDMMTRGRTIIGSKGAGGVIVGANSGIPGLEAALFESK
jgi:hypothetical protein